MGKLPDAPQIELENLSTIGAKTDDAVPNSLLPESGWRTTSVHTEQATRKGARNSGFSIQEKQVNTATGEVRVQHSVVNDTGEVVDGPHSRPYYKPRSGADDGPHSRPNYEPKSRVNDGS